MTMHASFNRRVGTKVKNGRVQRKNRHVPTVHQGYFIDREPPGRGRRHVLTKRDLQSFLDIIPDWDELSYRVERIVLSEGDDSADALYEFFRREETGGIYLCAWDKELWKEVSPQYFRDHETVFKTIGVSCEEKKKGVLCRFTEAQAKAFMLLHVFMHELGHHHDEVNQKHANTSRGEGYAERFATDRFTALYPAYVRVFGDPALSE
jgi:hypothetical protein